jgi:methylmalonyl-CoA/ethylmalonyl-CoA epimerase
MAEADRGVGSTTIVQVGVIVRDSEAKAQAWSSILGLPLPHIATTDTVDVARTTYEGQPSPARAKLAFFHLGQVDVELIEPIDGPSSPSSAVLTVQSPCNRGRQLSIVRLTDY